jgi:putative nucleotidyltransferase with HDIG domain
MYIHGFGGSWFRHPFWSSKFLLESAEDVARVRNSSVPYVLIDDALGIAPDAVRPEWRPAAATPVHASSRRAPSVVEGGFSEERRTSDRRRAQQLVQRSRKLMKNVFDRARLGRAVRVAEVIHIVDEISEAVARSPHALFSVTRLKRKDEYTYLHSVAVCTLMVNVARHLDLDDEMVRDLGLAGLLHDIGKMGIAEEVLNKPGRLTDEEFALMKTHPEYGYQLLCAAPDMRDIALDVCRHHHEKMDGTGYPFGMDGAQISLAARLGAICDVYDALTSDRPYKNAWSPAESVGAMWSWKGHFDPGLLFSFMRSIGVFPPGMLVSLRSNRLGVVTENRRRASRPRICAFYATREQCFIAPEIVAIKDSLDGDQILAPEMPANWGFTDWETMALHLRQGNMPPDSSKP